MNTKQSRERRERRLLELSDSKPIKRKRHVHITTIDDFPLSDVAANKLPDPWLIDSESLLRELARLRDLMLRVPIHADTHLPIQTAIDSIWRLEEQMRFLLGLHKDGQRAFARKTSDPSRDVNITESKISGIQA